MKYTMESVKKILIPTDGSDYSLHAAEYALSIAKQHNAQLTIIYVLDEVVIDRFTHVSEREDIEKELKEDGQRYINFILGLAEKKSVKANSLIVKGRPFEQIVHLANGLNMDLIVMGTYGRRGADRILIGNVAERVIEYAHCPVLVVK
jgi:nucleotide-binding universal stress UspA family protein